MEELVSRLVGNVALSEDQALRAIAIMVGFLKDAGPTEKVDRVIARLPGAQQVDSPFDGAFGGPTGAMAAFNALSASGLSMSQIQATLQEFMTYSKERAGEREVDELVRSIPSLSQFV